MAFALPFLFTTTVWALSFDPFELNQMAEKQFSAELKAAEVDAVHFHLNQKETENLGGAYRNGRLAMIQVGASAIEELTKEDFLFIYCHELGHILGGAPYKSGSSWASTEAQADYWSTHSCLPEFISPQVDQSYPQVVEKLALRFFSRLRNQIGEAAAELPFYFQPDPARLESEKFNSEYASFQCRFDTLMAGARRAARPSCWASFPLN